MAKMRLDKFIVSKRETFSYEGLRDFAWTNKETWRGEVFVDETAAIEAQTWTYNTNLSRPEQRDIENRMWIPTSEPVPDPSTLTFEGQPIF